MRKKPWHWVLIGLLIAIAGTVWYIGRVNSSHPALWAMTGGDSGHRNASSVPLPSRADIIWSYPLGAALRLNGFGRQVGLSSPVVWKDGTVYVSFDTKVYAISPEGTRKWTWESRTPIVSLALGRQGTVYAQADGMLYALKPDGAMDWELAVDVNQNEAKPLLVGQGGVIYVTGKEYLIAVSSTGERKWRFRGTNITGTPVELADGKLAVLLGSRLYVLNRDGDTAWDRETTLTDNSLMGLAAAGDRIYINGAERMVLNRESRTLFQAVASLPVSQAIGLGKNYVQDGVTRYNVNWEKVLWSNADGNLNSLSALAAVDPDGNVAVVTSIQSRGRQTFELNGTAFVLTPLQSEGRLSVSNFLRQYDAAGRLAWELKDAVPLGVPVPAGKGRLCFVGLVNGKDGTHLVCIGDK